jgi:hypothetical protein
MKDYKYLLLKAGNDIFVNDRQDKTKTDLQSNELIAFAKALSYAMNVNSSILLGCTAETMLNNNVSDYGMLLHDRHNIFSVDVYDNMLNSFKFTDKLIVFCGLWSDIDNQNSLSFKAKRIIEQFPGKVYYVYNDLRLPLHSSIDKSIVNLVTQAKNLDSVYYEGFKSICYAELQRLPFYYVQKPIRDFKTFDLSVSTMKIADLDAYRNQKFIELLSNASIFKLFIGSYDFKVNSKNYMSTGTVKHSKVDRYLKLAYSSYIVSEKLYDDNELVPNRLYEAILSNSGLIVDSNAYKTLCNVEPYIARYAELVESPNDITLDLVKSAYDKVLQLNTSDILSQHKKDFETRLRSIFVDNLL